MNLRTLSRSVVVSATAVALSLGTVSLAEAGGSSRATDRMTNTQHCAKEKKDVKAAKAKVVKAKKAKKNKAAKVVKAKKNLKKQKRQRNTWCARSAGSGNTGGTNTTTTNNYTILVQNPVLDALPAALHDPLVAALNQIITQLSAYDDQIPFATLAQLETIQTQLEAFDPAALQAAISALLAALPAGDPGVITALLQALLGTLPGGTSLPSSGDLAALQAVAITLLGQLQGFDPAAPSGVEDLTAQFGAVAAALTSGQTQFQDLVTTLTAVGGGTPSTDPAFYTALLASVYGTGPVPLTTPTTVPELQQIIDLLAALDAAYAGAGGQATLLDLFGPVILPLLN